MTARDLEACVEVAVPKLELALSNLRAKLPGGTWEEQELIRRAIRDLTVGTL